MTTETRDKFEHAKMSINWDDPAARYRLIESVGVDEYERLHCEHLRRSTVATVNGRAIRPVQTHFGRLYAVGGTNMAFRTLEEAKIFAAK